MIEITDFDKIRISRAICITNQIVKRQILEYDQFVRPNMFARMLRNQLESQLKCVLVSCPLEGPHKSFKFQLEQATSFIMESEDTAHNRSKRCADFLTETPLLFTIEELAPQQESNLLLLYDFDYDGISTAILSPSKEDNINAIKVFDREDIAVDFVSVDIQETTIEEDNEFTSKHEKKNANAN